MKKALIGLCLFAASNGFGEEAVYRVIGGAEFCAELMQKNAETGVASIQCMYAPEFNSHSESFLLTVE